MGKVQADTAELTEPATMTAFYAPEFSRRFIDAITQHFTVPMNAVSVITGRNGLQVTVAPSKLQKEDGSAADGKISVSLVELVSSNDLFKANAASISDGRLLASGGSYFIGMESRGQRLRLKKGESLSVHFPVHKRNEMELFYGERDSAQNMNWKAAGLLLQQEAETDAVNTESIGFNDTYGWETGGSGAELSNIPVGNVYKTLDDDVYYYNRKLKLRQMIDTINKHGLRVYVDTLYNWPNDLPKDKVLDSNYLTWIYGPIHTYRLNTCAAYLQEKAAEEKRKRRLQEEEENWKNRSLAGQIQKYYAPSAINRLGWINCDCFYQERNQVNTELELPITMGNGRMEYFIIFRSFNGLVNQQIDYAAGRKNVLEKLPEGESVTIVAFIKKDRVIYQSRQDFVVGKAGKQKLDFNRVRDEDIRKMFGKNVRI